MWHDPALLLGSVTSGLNDSCGDMGSRDGDGAHSQRWRRGALSALSWVREPVPRSARRCDSLEEGDDGFCEDVIPITGDHMGRVCLVYILGVRTLFEKTLG